MIEYSRKALKSLAFLYRPYNDIDVYVEDTLSRNMYEVLFQRMLAGRARVERVFQLGGKHAVLDECSKDQVDTTRHRIYIIDGDYDFTLGNERPKLEHLYRLNVYASENLVLSEAAVVEVAYESSTNESRDDVRVKIDYAGFITELTNILLPLFLLNAAIHKIKDERDLHVHIRTTNYPVLSMCEQTGKIPCISSAKVEQRINDVIEELIRDYGYDRNELQRYIADIEKNLPPVTTELVKYISAKTHILPLLLHRLKVNIHYSGTIEQLKVRLARFCELNIDPNLVNALLRTSQGLSINI